MMDAATDSHSRRRLLATVPVFAESFRFHAQSQMALRHARTETGQDFADFDAFLAWLRDAPKDQGWEPVPVYRF